MDNFIYKKKWFTAIIPANPKTASGTLTISDVVTDAETVVIGDNTYEIDINDTFTAGNIQVDVADLRNQATGTLTFSGTVSDGETVTIGTRIYEFDTAAESTITEGHVRVDVSAAQTATAAITALVAAITGDASAVVTAVDGEGDTVVVTSIAKGTTGNDYASTTTCANASWGAAKLAGGLDTITAANAVVGLVVAIAANDEVVNVADGDGDTVVVTAKAVGTGGNDIAVSTTLTNGTWGTDVTALSGGQYGTPCPDKDTLLYVLPYYYLCTVAGNKDDVAWQRFTPATY
jgi:hypothetical protein